MTVAALYDIHGNLPALEAVLREIAQMAVDRIVIGGDVVYGPMTRDTLRRLLDLDLPVEFIRGNAETSVLAEIAGAEGKTPVPKAIREVLQWEAQQVREYQSVLAAWPATLQQKIPGLGTVLFCHATPRDEDEVFLRSTKDEVLIPIFQSVDAAIVVCGHTHMQFDRRIGSVRVVNAGSVGMPFGPPGAYWLLLGPDVELRHTTYDLAEAAARIRATSYPQAQEFAATNVLEPPSEAAMLEVLNRFALKGA
jgi:predicted phosphodiesterase